MDKQKSQDLESIKQDDFNLHVKTFQQELKQKTSKQFPFLSSLCRALDNEGESSLLNSINNCPSDDNGIVNCIESGNYGYSDIIVLGIDEDLPTDYQCITDMETLSKKISTVVAVKTADASTTRYLSHVCIIATDSNEIPPPGFTLITKTPSGHDANLNPNTKGKSMYLCVRFASKGLRITSLGMISSKSRDDCEDHFRILHSIEGVDAVLGEKSQDPYYLTYTKNWEMLVATPESLVETIHHTLQETIKETEPHRECSPDLDLDDLDALGGLDAIPDVVRQESQTETSEKTIDMKITSLELVANDSDDSEDSIPITEILLDTDELRSYAEQFNTTIHSLLPLLIACHSDDSQLVKVALEHLYHFMTSMPIQLVNSKEDLIVDHLLSMIYDGILASFPICCCNLANLLIKIADSFSTISSSTMCIILSYLSAIQIQLFNMEDHHQESTSTYDKIVKNVQIFMSLMKSRIQSTEKTIPSSESLVLQEKLSSFAYILESPGMMDLDELVIEMKTVSECVSPVSSHQNFVMSLLLLLSQIRRYGRVFSYNLLKELLADDRTSFLKSNRMICVYRYVVIPSLILSLSVSDVLDIAVLRCVLDLLRVFWTNYRESLITELGIAMKFLVTLLQSDAIQPQNRLEIVACFSNIFSTPGYLIDAFVNFDNKENTLNPVTELVAWCGEYVSQFVDGRRPTPEELRLVNEGSELLKVIAGQIVNFSGGIQGQEQIKESPIEGTDLYKSSRGRLPSNLCLNNDLCGSAISPYGQGITKEALNLAKEKGIKKCIAMLVATGVIHRTADNIVQFILMNLSQLDENELGDYLGSDGGTTDEEKELMTQVRNRFVRGTNWKGMDLDIAIRHFLTRCGFRLPGEAQKIDRFVEAFSQCYWEDNSSMFTNSDVVFILTFSVIMLNSDAHNNNIKKEDKMTLEEFLRNNRGIDDGKDLDPIMMTKLYWSIVNNEIKMPNQNEKRVVVELPPDEKEHNALLAATQTHMALLKDYRLAFQLFDNKRSADMIETMWRCLWLEFAVYLDTVLVKGYLREELYEKSLDMLRFCLMTSWELSLEAPDKAFIDILQRTSASLKDTTGHELHIDGSKELDSVMNENNEYISRVFHLDRLISILKDCLMLSLDTKKVDDKMELFVDGSVTPEEGRKFIYDGMLTKRTHRGNLRTYRFFLFSDVLIYAKQNLFNKYKPHLIVKLEDCSLTEIDKSIDENALIINTNIKPIYLLFKDNREKAQWSRRLFNAILSRIKQQRARDIANSGKTEPGERKIRSGSVYTAMQTANSAEERAPVTEMGEMGGLPANLQAALNTAKELFSTVPSKEADRMTPLHAYYLRILYGKEEKCPPEVLTRLTPPVLQKWREIDDMGRETLYINFVVELASQNI